MYQPDYHGGSIVNLMASLQQGLGGLAHTYPPLKHLPISEVERYRQIVLWVIDGLGWHYLRAHPEAIHLNKHLAGRMNSVYPPTTASAITTYLTGMAPQQHGLTGWHIFFRELGACLAILPGKPRYGGVSLNMAGIDLQNLLGTTPFSACIPGPSTLLSPNAIAESDFNRSHLGPSQLIPYDSLIALQDNLVRLIEAGKQQYMFAYWSELDSIAHREGVWSDAARQHLKQIDACFGEIVTKCQDKDVLIIVTADHGFIDTKPSDRLSLDDFPKLSEYLALPLCGEPRSVSAYLRPGCESLFDDYLREQGSEVMVSYPSKRLIDAGWFGLGKPHPELDRRLGDRVLLMKGHYTLKDWLLQESRHELIGVHGGLSQEEWLVPLILAYGDA
jgi:hypothetical protein